MKTSIPNDQYHMDTLPRAPIPISSIEELLESHAKLRAEKPAIIAVDINRDQSQTISYSQLSSLVKRTASWLTELGISKGDRFAILMHNTPEVLILELAGAMLGAATVPLDFKRDTLDRKLFKLQDTGAKALFIKKESASSDDSNAIGEALPNLTIHTWSTMTEFDGLLPKNPTVFTTGTLEDYYVILYTSGTTALPKGVLLSTRACLTNAMGIVDWQHFTQHDVFTIVLPLHHINSTEFCLAMLLVGGTIVLTSRYSASRFWHTVNRCGATNTSVVPTILHDLLMRADEFKKSNLDISSLKRICIGSAPVMPEETMRFYDTFGVRVTQGYGQTETALRVGGVPVDTDEKTYRSLVKNNTIGTELANNHLAIMDKQNNEMPEGKEGEICISGPVLAQGYLNNPPETKKAFIGDWFHSSDLGYWKKIDDKKYFFIIGRIKEIIIKGGVNLSPSAIEDALLKSFPEIDEASVVGFPDERMGEEIAAVITLKNKVNQLNQSIIGAAQNGTIPGLSRFEMPKKVFVFDSLPKTSTGKIQRVEVKKAVAELMKKEIPKHFYVRQIDSHETETIKKALEINNARFSLVPSTVKEFIARATNGLFFGVFEEKEGLIGSLSCVQLKASIINRLKTWNEATAEGTLANNDPEGNTLLCVAISVQEKVSSIKYQVSRKETFSEKQLQELAKKHISAYVHSDKDHVLNFHRKPKGGIPGATVWKILENGRPEDKESVGYNVLMKYPTINEGTNILRSNAASPAILLIEHALLYAKEKGVQEVIAFSRPSDFRKFVEKELGV